MLQFRGHERGEATCFLGSGDVRLFITDGSDLVQGSELWWFKEAS